MFVSYRNSTLNPTGENRSHLTDGVSGFHDSLAVLPQSAQTKTLMLLWANGAIVVADNCRGVTVVLILC